MSIDGIWNHVSDIRGGRTIDTPEELWFHAVCYFEWCVQNPLMSAHVVKYPLRAEVISVPQMRAMTLPAFLIHAGITRAEFDRCKGLLEFERVCSIIETIIYDQKFSGAASGLLKEALITRDLGLADKVDHSSSDGTMSPAAVDKDLVANLARKLTGD